MVAGGGAARELHAAALRRAAAGAEHPFEPIETPNETPIREPIASPLLRRQARGGGWRQWAVREVAPVEFSQLLPLQGGEEATALVTDAATVLAVAHLRGEPAFRDALAAFLAVPPRTQLGFGKQSQCEPILSWSCGVVTPRCSPR